MAKVKYTFGSFTEPLQTSKDLFEVHAKDSRKLTIKRQDFLFGKELPCDFIFTNYYMAGVDGDRFILIPIILPDSKLEMEKFINKMPEDFRQSHLKAIDAISEWIDTKDYCIDTNSNDTYVHEIYDVLFHLAFEFEDVMQFEYHEGAVAKLNDLCFFVNGNKLGYNVYNGQSDAIIFAKGVYAGTCLKPEMIEF